ncbi:MAG: ShlB/FhaC/HecB family hemolysin secretion/activation protein [Betaproteobacteria bacterium]|nr:ShlB/FhaC/HecB family hemolysin secretion/activation protein [Betaproteobacteria bacterium]
MIEDVLVDAPNAVKGRRVGGRYLQWSLLVIGVLMNGYGFAQALPDAGRVLEGVRAPVPGVKKPVQINEASEPQTYRPALQEDSSIRIPVKDIRLSGFVVFPPTEMRPLYEGVLDREVSLGELTATVEKITTFYRDQGFLLARAYLPEQEIKDGVVEVTVLVGSFDRTHIVNQSRLNDEAAEALAQSVVKGAPVTEWAVERATYLAEDMPGVEARGLLRPGSVTGTTDFVLDLREDEPLRVLSFKYDNEGSMYTGRHRFNAGLNLSNPSGKGDRFSAQLLTTGIGVRSLSASYDYPLNYNGTRLTTTASYSTYQLMEDYRASFGRYGSAQVLGLSLTHAVKRTRLSNFYVTAGFDSKSMRDHTPLYDSLEDPLSDPLAKRRVNKLTFGISGNEKSKDGSRYFSYSLSSSIGYVSLLTSGLVLSDASVSTSGFFSKQELKLTYLQHLWDTNSLQIVYSGQRAGKNLDSSEQFSIGGSTGVRAYPQGEGGGDDVHQINVELQHGMGEMGGGFATGFLFFDHANSQIRHAPPAGYTGNRRQLSALGFGLDWNNSLGYTFRGIFAHRLGGSLAQAEPDSPHRLWVELGRTY